MDHLQSTNLKSLVVGTCVFIYLTFVLHLRTVIRQVAAHFHLLWQNLQIYYCHVTTSVSKK